MTSEVRSEGKRPDADIALIAPLAPEDAEAISTLAGGIWRHHYPDIISAAQIEYMLNQRYKPELIRTELQRRDLWWDKLLVGDEIAGFASYFLTGRPGEMKLDKLYVHQGHQRMGYGGMLITHVCGRARREGCSKLVLAVNKNNRNAIAAYYKYDFQLADAAVTDIGAGFVMDDYIMEKRL